MDTTLYGVLGVAQSAEESDVVRAYREKVKTHHPDVSDAPDARAQFKRIRTAKEVLTDEQERARYDDIGHEAYVRRHLDAATWQVSETPAGSRAASSVRESEGTATGSDATAERRGVRADGSGTAAAYYQPGERVGTTHGGHIASVSDVVRAVGPVLAGHLCLLLSTAVMAAWLLLGSTDGLPSLTATFVATAMVGITGCLSMLHLTSTLYR